MCSLRSLRLKALSQKNLTAKNAKKSRKGRKENPELGLLSVLCGIFCALCG